MDWKTWAILAVLVLVSTIIRTVIAGKNEKEIKQENENKKSESERAVSSALQSKNLRADLSFSSSEASMAVDREKGTLLIHYSSLDKSDCTLQLADLGEVTVVDRSSDFQHYQEMERLHKGVERKSLYRPFGSYSTREVKEGHEAFQYYVNSRAMVYGLSIARKSGAALQIPFYCYNSGLFWTEEQRLQQLKQFARQLNDAIKSAKANSAMA